MNYFRINDFETLQIQTNNPDEFFDVNSDISITQKAALVENILQGILKSITIGGVGGSRHPIDAYSLQCAGRDVRKKKKFITSSPLTYSPKSANQSTDHDKFFP